jgi:hypothetical protein
MAKERRLDDLIPSTRSILAACSREATRQAAIDRCFACARDDQAFLFDVLGGELPPPTTSDLASIVTKIGEPVPPLSGYRLRVIRAFERLLSEIGQRGGGTERAAFLRSKAVECRRIAGIASDAVIEQALHEHALEFDGLAAASELAASRGG